MVEVGKNPGEKTLSKYEIIFGRVVISELIQFL